MRSMLLLFCAAIGLCIALPGQARAARIDELSIEPGGTLDIQSFEVLTSTPADTVRQYIQSGQLYSSTHADMTDPLYTVGFESVVVDQQDAVRLVEALAGDANLDGVVDVSDLGILAGHWRQSGLWPEGDFSHDGFIDVSDLGILAGNWRAGTQLSPTPTVVPEPTVLSVLALSAGAWFRPRRKLRSRNFNFRL